MSRAKIKIERHHKELYGIFFLALGVFSGLCLLSYNPSDPAFNSASNMEQISNLGGIVGAYIAGILFDILGISAYVFSGALILMSAMQFMGRTIRVKWPEAIAYTILVIAASTILHLRFEVVMISGQPISGGGLIGSLLGVVLQKYLNKPGAYTAAGALFVLAFLYATHIPIKTLLNALRVSVLFIAESAVGIIVLTVKGVKFGVQHAWPVMVSIARFLFGAARKLFKLMLKQFEKKEEMIINKGTPVVPKKVANILAAQKPVRPAEPKEIVPPKPAAMVATTAIPATATATATAATAAETDPKIFARADKHKRSSETQLELAHISKDYVFPPLSLLDTKDQVKVDIDEESLKKNAVLLLKKLKDYDVEGKVTEIHPGPVVTMYEFEPAVGVKINKIVGLADDLAVAMGGRSIRIVPHLPGKAAIGIEIPNNVREIVWLKDIISDGKFAKSHSKLTIALGKNTQGSTVVSDLAKMPHLLIAGATGSGKSVAINTIICSILYKSTPQEVRMILVDPKTLELPMYNGIPHLLLPVVTQARQTNQALEWALREMERRYGLLSDVNARNIATYNSNIEQGTVKLVSPEEAERLAEEKPEAILHTGKLPYIVIIIDELADLIMVSSKDTEENVTRLAQMARAAGIHLIIATQRPSVDVITGLIKANFPTRIAFKVSSKHDSRTILDTSGAEHLLGNGDMLFMPPASSNLARIHGAYVTEEEIERIVKHLKDQGPPCYDESILRAPEGAGGDDNGEYDELYDTAVKLVAETRQASISMIQRRLRIGYNRAARMIDKMEAQGVVGPQDGSKPREVLVNNNA